MSNSRGISSKNPKSIFQKPPKFKTSYASSSSELRVSKIHPKSNYVLGGCKYSSGDYKILYPLVDSIQVNTLIKKHYKALEPPIQYDDVDGADICDPGATLYPSNIRIAYLINIRKTFKISPHYELVSATGDNKAHMPPRGYFTIYQEQLKEGLGFPVHPLFIETMDYWEIEIGHIAPNRIRQMATFIMICKNLDFQQI